MPYFRKKLTPIAVELYKTFTRSYTISTLFRNKTLEPNVLQQNSCPYFCLNSESGKGQREILECPALPRGSVSSESASSGTGGAPDIANCEPYISVNIPCRMMEVSDIPAVTG